MYPNPNEVDLILNSYASSAKILRELYLLFRTYQRKISISFICRRMGISSKGHLSYMMTGQRSIPSDYWPQIFQIFKLSDEQEKRFREILEADDEQNQERIRQSRQARLAM